MKKLLAITLSLLMVFSLTACGGSDSSASGDQIKIGVMQFGEFTALQNCYDGFVAGLEEAGYRNGENIKINMQSAATEPSNCPAIADAMVNDESDLIFAIATPSAMAIKEKTKDIPVLFSAVTDAVASGLINSNEAPGANLSGTSDMNPVAKQIDLIKELLPNTKKVAVFFCSSETNSEAQYKLAKAQIEKNGWECVRQTISAVDEAKSSIEALKGKVDCIYIPTDNTVSSAMNTVSGAADAIKIPIVCGEPGMVENGATLTLGIDYVELGKLTAAMAVKLLESDDPLGDIAKMKVECQEDNFITAINMKSVEALGLDVPASIMDRAQKMGE